jgi:hypothetical protein
MKPTRRELAAALLLPAASAQTQPAAGDLAAAARDRLRQSAAALARVDLPMSTEPSFQFKA